MPDIDNLYASESSLYKEKKQGNKNSENEEELQDEED